MDIFRKTNFYTDMKLAVIVLAVLIVCLLLSASPVFSQQKETISEKAFPDNIYITGEPANSSHIKYVISRFLEQAGYSADSVVNMNFGILRPGDSKNYKIPLKKVQTSGNDTAKVSCEKAVTVKNERVPPLSPVFLAFSNHPEKIKSPGLLYEVGLLQNKPVRLRYYHQGDNNSPAHYLGVFVINNSSKPARLRILESVGGPSKDWILAGHLNNLKFFSNLEDQLGWIETVPPKSVYLLRRVWLKPGEVVSSTADLHLLDGGPLQLLTYAYEKPGDEVTYPLKVDEKDPHERGAYPITEIFTDVSYSIDDKTAYYSIGDTPFADILKGRSIKGSYGIMYQYEFTLKNPYDTDKTVSFFFQPRGGVATATFSFDNRPISVGLTKAYEMVRLARIKIPAKTTRKLSVKTMPEDASNYPIRIILMSDS
jgi:hypothetical protein